MVLGFGIWDRGLGLGVKGSGRVLRLGRKEAVNSVWGSVGIMDL